MAQTVKIPSAMQETWVQSLDWEDSLEECMASYSSIFAWSIPMDRGAWRATVHRVRKRQTQLSDQATMATVHCFIPLVGSLQSESLK